MSSSTEAYGLSIGIVLLFFFLFAVIFLILILYSFLYFFRKYPAHLHIIMLFLFIPYCDKIHLSRRIISINIESGFLEILSSSTLVDGDNASLFCVHKTNRNGQ